MKQAKESKYRKNIGLYLPILWLLRLLFVLEKIDVVGKSYDGWRELSFTLILENFDNATIDRADYDPGTSPIS